MPLHLKCCSLKTTQLISDEKKKFEKISAIYKYFIHTYILFSCGNGVYGSRSIFIIPVNKQGIQARR